MIGNFKKNKFILDTPKPPRHWTNRLFNDEYVVELNQTMQGNSKTFVNYNTTEFIKSQRHFYIRDIKTGDIFCPLYSPLKTKLDNFKSVYGLGTQEVISEYKGIKTFIRAFVPQNGFKEIWTVKIVNLSQEDKELSLFSAFSFEDFSFMGSYCKYDEENNYI